MPIADYLCGQCGAVVEHFFHVPPDEIPCEAPDCPGPARRTFEPSVALRRPRAAQPFDPVVIHRDANGNVRLPGSPDAPVPPGFQRVELRTIQEVRRFEKQMDGRERQRHDEAAQREESFYGGIKAARRAELRALMPRMSPAGREFAEEAIRRNDEKPRPRFDPGFHVEAFSQDSSNREPHRDARTGWKPRKG